MAFFKGYFDESGKHQNDSIVSFCGFVESDWEPFENEWRYLLRRHKMAELHVSKASLKAGSAQLKIYSQFIQAIKKTVEKGFAICVDVAAFNAAGKAVRSEYRNDAHFLAFSAALRDVVKYVSVLPNPQVSLICDDEPSKNLLK